VAQAQPQQSAPQPAPAPEAPAFDAQMRKMMAMTPQQRQQEVQRLHEMIFRSSFTRAGFNDLEMQDTVWE
jgi:hypothetical protein